MKAACYSFDSESSRCGAGWWGSQRHLDSVAARSGSDDVGGGR
jgi:hypothetical protein